MSQHLNAPDAFDAPLVEVVGGESVTFPLLTFDDLLRLCRELHGERKLKAINALALTDVAGRRQVSAWYDDNEPDVEELARYVITLPGARHFLRASLAKSGRTDADAVIVRLAASRGWRGVASLACRVSALFEPLPPAKAEDDGRRADPNGGAADRRTPDPAAAETGSKTESSSAA